MASRPLVLYVRAVAARAAAPFALFERCAFRQPAAVVFSSCSLGPYPLRQALSRARSFRQQPFYSFQATGRIFISAMSNSFTTCWVHISSDGDGGSAPKLRKFSALNFINFSQHHRAFNVNKNLATSQRRRAASHSPPTPASMIHHFRCVLSIMSLKNVPIC